MEHIIILTDKNRIVDGAWDYPFEELDYLMEKHDHSVYILGDDRRLYEGDASGLHFGLKEQDADDHAGEFYFGGVPYILGKPVYVLCGRSDERGSEWSPVKCETDLIKTAKHKAFAGTIIGLELDPDPQPFPARARRMTIKLECSDEPIIIEEFHLMYIGRSPHEARMRAGYKQTKDKSHEI